jgi:hypothetical protein
MFCPQCGLTQSDEVKFCKACGANLQAVRLAAASREDADKFDWSKTWVAEMFLSESERKRRNEALERERGITPEVKRYNEIKAGVIVSCIGLGVMIFLAIFMQGIILSGQNSAGDNEILSRIWVAGVIPFFVGLALIINGLFVSKRQAEAARRAAQAGLHSSDNRVTTNSLDEGVRPRAFHSADASEFIPPGFSVTDSTTRHLNVPARKLQDTEKS